MEISLQEVAQQLDQANRLVITGHIHPDGDCLGSMLALFEHLVGTGKQVSLLLDDDIPGTFRFLQHWQHIQRPTDKRIEADLLIVLDASDAERIAGVKATVNAPILNIDHHISNTKFADYWYIDSAAAATGAIIFELLKVMKASITKDMAVCLYTAIATDCGHFRYANTTAVTLRIAADLVELGAQPHIISEFLETQPLQSITTLTRVLQTLETFRAGKIAAITVDADILGEGSEMTDGFINYPRNIDGVEIAILFRPAAEATRVSFRSRTVDVSRLALLFGGGGHARASGCTATGDFAAVKTKVLEQAGRLLQESGL